jgi:hypothetical protein
MKMLAGLNAGGMTTAICIVDDAGKIVRRGVADRHPDAIASRRQGILTLTGGVSFLRKTVLRNQASAPPVNSQASFSRKQESLFSAVTMP